MSDLPQRLRLTSFPCCQEAAARIEALEFEVEHERYNVEKTAQEAAKRIKALEAALKEAGDVQRGMQADRETGGGAAGD